MPVLNIAAYRFAPIDEPAGWIDPIRARAAALDLKGTVIVATEGINLFLAGDEAAIDRFVAWLRDDPRFVGSDGAPLLRDVAVKRSWSPTQPFGRLRVKHKPEIVTMRRPAIRPDAGRAPSIDPVRLSEWLSRGHDDRGRPVTLLDTRNAFEVAHGTFDGARHLGLARFDQFPDAADRLPPALRDQTVVAFCTGGIRCEKAALYLRDAGFAHAVQLDGGILGYLETVGDAHWRGACFVFDERTALDADLAPVTIADQPSGTSPGPTPASASISSDVKPAARRADRLNGPRRRGAR